MDKKEVGSLTPSKLLEKLETNSAGLTSETVKKRLVTYGHNILPVNSRSIFLLFLRQFKSSLIYLLVAAGLISFFLGEVTDSFIITVILLINASLGFFQEYRSEKAAEQLSRFISNRVLVRRDNEAVLIDEKQIVPGDIVLIKEGDIVSADCMLIESDGLEVNQSQLTGESLPVPKKEGGLVFSGSTVEKGIGTAVVYATGQKTEYGKIAALSVSTRKITRYEKSLADFSSFLIKVISLILVLVFVAKLFFTGNFSHLPVLLLFIIALAIAVVPEALPVIVTVTLSHGALRLAKRNVIVRRLSSMEDLGNVEILCTDKTGTITENKMAVRRIVSANPELFQKFAAAAVGIQYTRRKKYQNAYDSAFLDFIPPQVILRSKEFKIIREIPFDPALRRRSLVFFDNKAKKYFLVAFGAVDTLADLSLHQDRNVLKREIALEGKRGLRHLAIAYKEIEYDSGINLTAAETGLRFLGFAVFSNPLRPDVGHTLSVARKLGLAIKILTGDTREVSEYTAREVGLLKENGKVYTGTDLEKMSPGEFQSAVEQNDVFAQITPSQKYDIIRVLKEKHVVAYQGDGINDAPALTLADVAIAVSSATDVAKESADIILLNRDLGVIVSGIRYGRLIFLNINKYIKYTMVGNFGNFFALAVLYLLSFDLPILPIQLLLTSLITDLPLVAISSDTVEGGETVLPEKYDTRSLMFISLVLGSLTAIFEIIFYAGLSGQPVAVSRTSLFIFLSLIQLVVIFIVRSRGYFWREKRSSLTFTASVLIACLIVLILPYLDLLSRLFFFSPLSVSRLSGIFLMVFLYLFVIDIVKVWYYRKIETKFV